LGPRCPICGKAATGEQRPFCSDRCTEVDLGRWLGGAYAIPAVEPQDDVDLDGMELVSDDNRPACKPQG